MKYRLKKIDLGSVALYSLVFYTLFTLLALLPFILIFAFLSSIIPSDFTGQGLPLYGFEYFGGIFIIVLAAGNVIFGTLINVLLALVYNLLSLKMGGLKFVLDDIEELQTEWN